jgi:hypothetical protein
MAATTAIVKRGASGDLFDRLVDVTLDASYPAGGYPLTPQQLGFGLNGSIVFVDGAASKTGGWEAGWDYTNGKLQVFDSSGAASAAMHEVAPATVLTGVVVRLACKGVGQG